MATDLKGHAMGLFAAAGVETPALLLVIDSASVSDRRFVSSLRLALPADAEARVVLVDSSGGFTSLGPEAGLEFEEGDNALAVAGALPRGAAMGVARGGEHIVLRPPIKVEVVVALAGIIDSNEQVAVARKRVLSELRASLGEQLIRSPSPQSRVDSHVALFTDVCVTCPTGGVWNRIVNATANGEERWTVFLPREYQLLVEEAAQNPNLNGVPYVPDSAALGELLLEARALGLVTPFEWVGERPGTGS